MNVIDWPGLQPLPPELQALQERLQAALPLRSLCRSLVEVTLRAYPWNGRADLVPCYHPSQTYRAGQRIAIFLSDPQSVHPAVWLVAQVSEARFVQNPVQGRFQAVTLGIQGRQVQMAGGIAGASYPEPELSSCSPEELAWLADWVSETYRASLQAALRRLIEDGQLRGRLAGETFLPEPLLALSAELLHPCFAALSRARPWISLQEMRGDLSDLAVLERETALRLLREALQASPYRPLGGDRWTTPELFDWLDRKVPLGLPLSARPENGSTWTDPDEQSLAGYGGAFMPAEARRALEELGLVERPGRPPASPWQPPRDPAPLPALTTLHMTQAYFPVGKAMEVFAPDARLVFVQFVHGEHQPFVLDREHALLKAVRPQWLYTRILEEDLPAGASLWLEYQGNERYRIAPRLLPFKRMVPCKLATLRDGRLHVEHTYISMPHEGRPSLFTTRLRFEQIEALFGEASRRKRSLREAIGDAVRAICATDPDRRAHRRDIFNAVFLEQMCSPTAVSVLLHTQPCFESLGGGYFRYKPMQATLLQPRKKDERLSRLWDDLRADPVAPHPAAEARYEARYAPEAALPSGVSLPDSAPPATVWSVATLEEDPAGTVALQEEERIEPVLVSHPEPGSFTGSEQPEAERRSWRASLGEALRGLVEPVRAEAEDEPEAPADMSLEAAHEASLSYSSPFSWEPKRAWVQPPVQSNSQYVNRTHPRYYTSTPRVPLRPLHKQPFLKRFFFYLRRWLRGAPRRPYDRSSG